jgi:uncharacterized protein (DUF924 family)
MSEASGFERGDEVLEYWLGGPNGLDYDEKWAERWFREGRRYDTEIRERFGELHACAARGDLDHWAETPRGRLALIVLLDQFSRHIHRGTPHAFANDYKAQRLALDGIAAAQDLELRPIERAFFYMPLEHAEDPAIQNVSVRAFGRLLHSLPAEVRPRYQGFYDYAVRHREVIERFGRFPDLNPILARPSTPEELEFLTRPGSSFL